MKRGTIIKNVEILLRENGKLTVEEAIQLIEKKLGLKTTYHTVKKALERFVEDGKAIKTREDKEDVYIWTDPQTSLLKFITIPKSTIEWERLREEEPNIAEYLAKILRQDMDRNELQKKLGDVAKRLVKEDPVEIFLSFCKWTWYKWKNILENYRADLPKKKREDIERKLRRIEDFSSRYFNTRLGIPIDMFRLYREENSSREIHEPDWEKIKKFFRGKIQGSTFLEIRKISKENVSIIEAGTDSSMQSILTKDMLPTFLETSVPIGIVTSVGITYDISSKRHGPIDVRPEPNSWKEYPTSKAINEGILIPPQAYLEEPKFWRRIVEAVMDTRQYSHDFEYFILTKDGKKISIIFRDGRIFPLEHPFQDFIHEGKHGEYVRMALKKFWDVVGQAGISEDSTVYCGVVKQPHVNIISPVVFWYLKYSEDPVWPDMSEEEEIRYIFESTVPDNLVCLLMFSSLGTVERNSIILTFRYITHFYEISGELYQTYQRKRSGGEISSPVTKEIMYELAKRICRDRKISWVGDGDLTLYSELCTKAATASFFVWSSMGSFKDIPPWFYSIPRYEILIPFPYLSLLASHRIKEFNKKLELLIDKVCRTLSDPQTLDIYTDMFMIERRLIMPVPVCLAHQYSHDIGVIFRNEFLGFLFSKLRELKV